MSAAHLLESFWDTVSLLTVYIFKGPDQRAVCIRKVAVDRRAPAAAKAVPLRVGQAAGTEPALARLWPRLL